jgi:hypothetical protein
MLCAVYFWANSGSELKITRPRSSLTDFGPIWRSEIFQVTKAQGGPLLGLKGVHDYDDELFVRVST